MSFESNGSRDPIRIFVCGSCEGSASLVEALAQESDLELVGVAQRAQDAASALAGGHLSVVLQARHPRVWPGMM